MIVDAQQRAIGRRLESAELRPAGLPPAAVLVVRRLEDPLPGSVLTTTRPPRLNPGWERAVRLRLADLYRHAARPAHEHAPGNAEAVLFADESELLACLALDVGRGLAQQYWWWQAILTAHSGRRLRLAPVQAEFAEALVVRMERQAERVPAAFAWLEQRGAASLAVGVLAPMQAWRVLNAALAAHGLPPVGAGEIIADQDGPAVVSPGAPKRPAAAPPPAPWRPLSAGLGFEQEMLLGWCLDLYRRPTAAASPTYRRQALAWLRTVSMNGVPQAPAAPTDRMVTALPEPAQPAGAGRVEDGPPAGRQGPAPASAPEAEALPLPVRPGPEDTAGANDHVVQSGTTQAHPVAISAESRHDRPGQDDARPADSDDSLWTEIGGCLYLVNLMAHLGLPAAGEAGWRLAGGVGAWGLLEALSREMLGPTHTGDPLWAALARLDGRQPAEDRPPGWRLPRSRPRRWPAFEFPGGWPGTAPPPAAGIPRRRKLYGQGYPPLLKRWLQLALPWIERRLCLALQLDNDRDIATTLLHLPARLYLTRSQVDLVASIEAIALPVRIAGLDRDPGWQPVFGRVIYFHFEEE